MRDCRLESKQESESKNKDRHIWPRFGLREGCGIVWPFVEMTVEFLYSFFGALADPKSGFEDQYVMVGRWGNCITSLAFLFSLVLYVLVKSKSPYEYVSIFCCKVMEALLVGLVNLVDGLSFTVFRPAFGISAGAIIVCIVFDVWQQIRNVSARVESLLENRRSSDMGFWEYAKLSAREICGFDGSTSPKVARMKWYFYLAYTLAFVYCCCFWLDKKQRVGAT